jgi:CheY-like chemotaxis protein
MESKTQLSKSALHVLLVGNNPIDMGAILDKLNQIRGTKIITEIAFDVQSLLERLIRFKPNYILIDDNIGKVELAQTVSALAQRHRTRNVPITVLKNSNYQEAIECKTIIDYLLKNNLSSERLYNALRNSLRFKRTQMLLHKAYQKRRQFFKKALA